MSESTAPSAIEDVPDWVSAYTSTCIGCTRTDNHPKILTGPLEAPPVYWHHDCYVIAKAPGWEDIKAAIEGAQGATGHALREHLMDNATNATGQEN